MPQLGFSYYFQNVNNFILEKCTNIKIMSIFTGQTQKMTTIKTNIWNLQVGDVITFTNSVNYKVSITVTRVEDKSWYATGRNSWGTLQSYSKYPDFKIIKNEN